MAKKGVLLTDKDENFLYPQTILEMVTNKDQSATLDVLLQVLRENLESSIENTNLNVSNLRDELSALLSDVTLSGEVRDAILEINSLLNSGSSDITSEVVTSIRQLKEDAVLHSEQSLTSSQKQQARKNVDAVGVVTTYGDGGSWATLSYNDKTIYPETKGKQVKMSNGSNVEDAINTYTSNISANTENIKEKIGLVGPPTVENGVQSGTLGYKNQPLFPTTRDNKVFVQSKSRTLDVVINDIETDISKEETRAQQVEMYLESQKANKYGYYEGLSVGVSDNLSGRGEATDSEFSMRPSGGENKSIQDGTARINSIKGNSVVWNSEYKSSTVSVKMTIVSANFVYRASLGVNIQQTKGDKIYICQTLNNKVDLRADSTFLTRTFGYNTANRKEIPVGGVGNTFEVNPSFFTKGVHTFATIHTVGDYAIDTMFCDLQQEDGMTEYSEYSVKLVNLTKMFNGVNVPTTVEEFEALYGNMPDEYNEGNIIDNHTTAIKSVGVNAWDEEWESGVIDATGVPINNVNCKRTKNFIKVISGLTYNAAFKGNKITNTHAFLYRRDKTFIRIAYNLETVKNLIIPSDCEFVKITFGDNANPFTGIPEMSFHLVHTGYLNGKYFPYESQTRELPTVEGGLKSAGTACDEIRYNKGKDKWEHVQRVGSVDLGTLEWYYGNPSGNAKKVFYSKNVKTKLGITPAQSDTLKSNILNVNYISAVPYDTLVVESVKKVITAWANKAELYRIVVADTAYADATTFKEAMQGVILYYELAEPVVTELDVDISPDYKVWDYGTEEAISEVLSTPVRVNANYGFNAVGQITDNTMLIQELLARVAALEAQIAQQTNAAALVQDVDE